MLSPDSAFDRTTALRHYAVLRSTDAANQRGREDVITSMSEPKRTWRDSIEIPEGWEWAEAINWLLCAGVVLVMGALLALTVFRELIENGRWFPLAILVALLAVALRAVVLDFYRHRLRLVTAGLLAIWFGATAMVWLGVLKFR